MSLGHFGGQKQLFLGLKTQEYKNIQLKSKWLYQQIDGQICIWYMFFCKKIAEFAIILELNGYSGCMEIG